MVKRKIILILKNITMDFSFITESQLFHLTDDNRVLISREEDFILV